jgi:hypothetical protein
VLFGRTYEVINFGLCIYTTCVIIIIGGALWSYKSTRAFWTRHVKRAYFQFALMGTFPWLITGWLLLLDIGYTGELVVAVLYCTGITAILLRQYALTFLKELDKMPNYPHSKYQLQVFNEIKDQKVFYFVVTIYFFIMGTLALFALTK